MYSFCVTCFSSPSQVQAVRTVEERLHEQARVVGAHQNQPPQEDKVHHDAGHQGTIRYNV